MRIKKIIAVILMMLSVCLSFSLPTYAVENGIAPAYEIASNVTSTMNINGSTATCVSVASGTDGSKVTVTQTLQKYSGLLWIWNDVDGASWSKTSNSNMINLTSTKSGLSSGTYRLKSVFTLTNSSGETETITVYSDEKTI